MKIYLLRHAKTKANEEKRYTGKNEIDISEKGISEILEVKKYTNYPENIDLYASSLNRTKQTLEVIYGKNVNIKELLPFLDEINFGDFEGLTYQDLKHNKNYLSWINDHFNITPINGENYQDFKKRVITNFLDYVKTLKSDSLFMTHGGVIRVIMSTLIDESRNFFEWEIPNGLGYVLEYEGGKFIGYEIFQ
ncbi:histidine phosphatase family protein [Mycoplasmatota bacterium]|nr:histidine phosphatase family protein [Mycoplasmatota bacterium]